MAVKKENFKRLEIVYSQAVREDIFEALRHKGLAKHFTRFNNIYGAGCSDPKLGDAIWPQVNEILLLVCPEEDVKTTAEVIAEIREKYPTEGIACFVSDVQII